MTMDQTSSRRVIIIVVIASVVVVLAVAGAAWAVVSTLQAQERQRAYEVCMAGAGFAFDEPVPDGVDSDAYIEAMVEASERCLD